MPGKFTMSLLSNYTVKNRRKIIRAYFEYVEHENGVENAKTANPGSIWKTRAQSLRVCRFRVLDPST